MSRSSDTTLLPKTFERLARNDRPPKIAILGIGHELRGDDAVGIAVVRALRQFVSLNNRLLLIDAGPMPENFTGKLRSFRPDIVLMVDAAQLEEAPGTVRWVAWRDIAGFSVSSHTLPLHLLAGYLASELECDVALLGIQPADMTIGAPLSQTMQQAVDRIVKALTDILQYEPSVVPAGAGLRSS